MPETLPYGSWPSPLSPAVATAASARFDGARFVGDEIWWAQSVPEEGGRMTVRARDAAGAVREILPVPWNARSSVHEYGGGAWAATEAGELVFVERTDQRVWILRGDEARPLTPGGLGMRFGGLAAQAGRLLAVRETHVPEGAETHDIVIVPLDGAAAEDAAALEVVVPAGGFAAQPALAPDGSRLAWIAWAHPDMPWDRARLRVRDRDGAVWEAPGTGSALQPAWTGPDELTFLDDRSGRWNLARTRPGSDRVEPLAPADADTGGALWVLGTRWYAPLGDGRIAAIRTHGSDELVVVDPRTGASRTVATPVTSQAVLEDARGSRVLLSGAGPRHPSGLWLVDVDGDGDGADAVRIAGGLWPWGAEWLPTGRAFTAQGPHGPVHAFDFPPTHPDVRGPEGELPPYVVLVHGGPTSHVGGDPSAKIAFFTSRGIGVLDVNYGGSTGYGRAYRERLRGQWGLVDVDDVAAAARALADEGRADPARIAIEGGSAGGWTVLGALVRTDAFSAGISRYGVADARALAADTHDFESRYLDGLIGPLPEAEAVYLERSPLSAADRIRVPLLLMQGTEDRVVPPAQSEALRDALAAGGIPHEYVLYEGEGHGFRRADTMQDVLARELAFLAAAFRFTPSP